MNDTQRSRVGALDAGGRRNSDTASAPTAAVRRQRTKQQTPLTEMRRRKQLGELASVKPSRVTLDEFAREWWQRYASTELARTTQERHAAVWDLHVLPRLGGVQMGQLNPGVIDAFQAELRKAGVGEPTIRKTLALLQAVCRVARERVRPWCDLRPIVARTKNETPRVAGLS